ncbi:MAG: T9SS type A sorting domain-containing protein [Bacteroidetes bacterium]|nr:T9SS type A sorting domain-containing protein [Bacteroidota bacterium]
MKRSLLFIVAIMAATVTFSQVQRNKVILEISTGTWCTYCPGAAVAADNLVASGANVATIEYHNGDAYANSYSNARNTYYAITGYPTAHFDGPTSVVGGYACPGTGLSYTNNYNTAYAVPSPLTVDISGTNAGNSYNLVLSVHKVSTVTATDLRLHVVLAETDISCAPWPGGSGCMTKVNFVERLMAPNESGTSFSFTSGDMQIILVSFTKDASWVNSNCSVIAFVQDNPTKTIFNGSMVALNSIPAPIPVNFSSNTATGCAPVTINYTDQSVGVNNWQWDLPGGSPSAPTTQNPSVSYASTGTYDATLTAWNSTTYRGNKMVKTAYLNILAIPDAPGMPSGATQLCSNPPNQTYFAAPASGATTYTWDLQPPTAGILTPAGASCTVDFDNAYTGSAQLKVKGSNSCGDGAWSPTQAVTVSNPPAAPGTPTGQTQLCLNPPNTDYQTSGSSSATSYVWELTPTPAAGSITGSSTTGIVDWATFYVGAAQIRVKAVTNGCEGAWSSYLNVNVESLPGSYSMTGGGATCATGGSGVAVGLDGSQAGVNYTLYLNGGSTSTIVPGTGGAITFGNQFLEGSYSAEAVNPATTCTNMMNGSAIVTVDPQVPEAPAQPTGNGTPAPGTVTDYTTTGGIYATSYSWAVTPANAGTFTGTGTTGSITWSTSYLGNASIKVQGVNSCGAGSFSIDLPVIVVTGIGEHSQQKLVTLFPNPAKGKISIIADHKMKTDLKVFNSLGTVVMEKNGLDLDGACTLDISGLAPGIYYFSLLTDDAKQIQKVIVQ